jgi:DNA-binding protein Rv2175c, wHTH domain
MKHSTQRKMEERSQKPDIPAGLYAEARRRLLQNEPLLERSTGLRAGALSAGEVAAMESVGLTTEPFAAKPNPPGGDPPGGDPLVQSVADYMALLETSYTTSEASKQLKVDVSRVRQRLREGTLFGVEYDGERRLPRFQFERRQVLPGLREVIAALPVGLNPLDVAQWFLAPNPDLEAGEESLSPREWLLRGKPVEAVAALARGFE